MTFAKYVRVEMYCKSHGYRCVTLILPGTRSRHSSGRVDVLSSDSIQELHQSPILVFSSTRGQDVLAYCKAACQPSCGIQRYFSLPVS